MFTHFDERAKADQGVQGQLHVQVQHLRGSETIVLVPLSDRICLGRTRLCPKAAYTLNSPTVSGAMAQQVCISPRATWRAWAQQAAETWDSARQGLFSRHRVPLDLVEPQHYCRGRRRRRCCDKRTSCASLLATREAAHLAPKYPQATPMIGFPDITPFPIRCLFPWLNIYEKVFCYVKNRMKKDDIGDKPGAIPCLISSQWRRNF